jgi:hypothetical protein
MGGTASRSVPTITRAKPISAFLLKRRVSATNFATSLLSAVRAVPVPGTSGDVAKNNSSATPVRLKARPTRLHTEIQNARGRRRMYHMRSGPANLVADIVPCSAARNAVAGAAVPGERAPAAAGRGSPSVPLCGDFDGSDRTRWPRIVPGSTLRSVRLSAQGSCFERWAFSAAASNPLRRPYSDVLTSPTGAPPTAKG